MVAVAVAVVVAVAVFCLNDSEATAFAGRSPRGGDEPRLQPGNSSVKKELNSRACVLRRAMATQVGEPVCLEGRTGGTAEPQVCQASAKCCCRRVATSSRLRMRMATRPQGDRSTGSRARIAHAQEPVARAQERSALRTGARKRKRRMRYAGELRGSRERKRGVRCARPLAGRRERP